MDKSPKAKGYTPKQFITASIGTALLVIAVLFGVKYMTPAASADQIVTTTPEEHRVTSEEIPSGVATMDTGKQCDIYVTTANEGVWDWAVDKAKEFGCELRGMFTKEESAVTVDVQTSIDVATPDTAS